MNRMCFTRHCLDFMFFCSGSAGILAARGRGSDTMATRAGMRTAGALSTDTLMDATVDPLAHLPRYGVCFVAEFS